MTALPAASLTAESSAEKLHGIRALIDGELDGSATVLADAFDGKRLNSPNDVVPHPDGSYWFTDPPYGGQLYEGTPDVAGGPSNAAGKLNPRLGQPPGIGTAKRELPTNCYRIDPSGRIDLVIQSIGGHLQDDAIGITRCLVADPAAIGLDPEALDALVDRVYRPDLYRDAAEISGHLLA